MMKKLTFICSITLFSLVIQSQNPRPLTLIPQLKPFYHGVASGDPLFDRVIIWTRLTPDSNFTALHDVEWRVATDTGMSQVVQQGIYTTGMAQDFTVKVDVTGLQPNTWYYYEFTNQNRHSIRGRTKTAPQNMKDSLRFGVVSCANYESGYFNAYKVMLNRNDLDAVVHLGDYIYEYETGGYALNSSVNTLFDPAHEIITLSDYRTRYSQIRLDQDLMRLHQQYPFITVWDDHESANDSWMDGAENHNSGEGPWADRKSNAQQAYFEWLPIRPASSGNNNRIYRNIRYGNLVELFMLDTRLYGRQEQAGTTGSTVNDANRTILGADQYTWLSNGMFNSTSQWKILGQQVMFAPLSVFGIGVNGDQWDGYPAERTKIISFVLANSITGVVVITGDIHTAWANDVPTANYQSNGTGSAFVEFVGTSVTSPGFPFSVGSSVIQAANNHIKYINLVDHGFFVLDINQNRAQSDYFYVNTLDTPSDQYNWGASWYVNHNERHLRSTSTASFPRNELNHQQAPIWPRNYIPVDPTGLQSQDDMICLSVYPNPFEHGVYIQYQVNKPGIIHSRVLDMQGKTVFAGSYENEITGIRAIYIPLQLSVGTYVVQLMQDNKITLSTTIIRK
ncbi:MAG: alkaline phosphatase D family protein [Candidatus Competibacteraceae bacterium]|nr:alkaline phosphatase D family protein [Candidatus Competibacteraceae bacterium]